MSNIRDDASALEKDYDTTIYTQFFWSNLPAECSQMNLLQYHQKSLCVDLTRLAIEQTKHHVNEYNRNVSTYSKE